MSCGMCNISYELRVSFSSVVSLGYVLINSKRSTLVNEFEVVEFVKCWFECRWSWGIPYSTESLTLINREIRCLTNYCVGVPWLGRTKTLNTNSMGLQDKQNFLHNSRWCHVIIRNPAIIDVTLTSDSENNKKQRPFKHTTKFV